MARNHLVLEDGTVLEGEAFGYEKAETGEVVFTTAMGGYQESITDPSYQGQILIDTYPLVGNYGIMDAANQSSGVHIRALVVREYCKEPSLMYGGRTLDSFLKEHKVPAISGIDTRELVLKIRSQGTLKGAIVYDDALIDETISELKKMPAPSESNLVAEVTCEKEYYVDNGKDVTVGVIDCGTKNGILASLSKRCNLRVFPYDTPAQAIVDSKVDGVLITNGPGDPSHPAIVKTVVKACSDLMQEMPVMGICFGSQVLGLALGGKTYKMKYGHRGINQPVRYNERVYITSQNHGFAVDEHSLDGKDVVVNQININDKTVEGLQHKNLPVFTCQYHPEARAGPDDTSFIFDNFAKTMREAKR